MKSLDGKHLVTQSNNLIEARYSITKNEQLILCAMMSFINPNDTDFLTYKTSISQFVNLLNVDNKSATREIRGVIKRLLSRVLEIETPHGWEMFQWVSFAKVDMEKDELLLRFHDKLKPYLLELKGRFTKLKLQEVVKLKSVYSIRMYQILIDFHGRKQSSFIYTLEDFRQIILGRDSKKYPSFKYFRMKVLNISQKELNQKSNLSFTFKTIRIGRKIGKIEFQIVELNNSQMSLPINPVNDLKESPEYQELTLLGIQPAQAITWLEKHGKKYIQEKLIFVKHEHANGRIKSSVSGFLTSAINKNFKSEYQLQKELQAREHQKRLETERQRKEVEDAPVDNLAYFERMHREYGDKFNVPKDIMEKLKAQGKW